MTDNKKDLVKDSTKKEPEIREIDYSVVNAGPLFIPKDLKDPAYEYEWVGDEARQIYTYQRSGWEVVHKDEIPEFGQETPSRATKYSDAVLVQSKDGSIQVLMKMPKVMHEKMMKWRHDKNKEQTDQIGDMSQIPQEYRIGHNKNS